MSDSNSYIKRTPERALDPKQHAERRKLLFINCFSVDRTRKSHNPDKKTIGAHVQRIIRKTKRIDAAIKLKPVTSDKMVLRYHSRDTTEDEVVALTSQCSGVGNRNVSLGHDVAKCPPLAQTASNLDELKSEPSSRQNSEDQLKKVLILLERMVLRLPKVCEPLGTEVFDTVVSGGLSDSRLAKTVFQFCESAHLGLNPDILQCNRFQRASQPLHTLQLDEPLLTTNWTVLETFIPRFFPVSTEAEKHCSWVIQSVLTSSELLFAILAISAASFLAFTRNPRTTLVDWADTEDRYEAISMCESVTFKIIAVKLLRSAIENNTAPNPDILLYSIMCLMVTEIVDGDKMAVQVHTNALRSLMQSRGRYENVPSHIYETLLSSCYISSIITGDPPIPPPLHGAAKTRAKGHDTFPSIFCASSHLRQLGQAFSEPRIKKILGPQLVSIFRDMSTFISWREYYHLSRSHPNPEEMDYIHALHWRSHFSALNFPFEPQHAQNNMQEPCRIALLIFCNTNNQINQPGSVLYRTLAAQLSDTLERSVLESFWESSHGILMWILFLGAFITEGQPESRWFVMNIASGLRNIQINWWAEMETILLRFFYLERIHQNAFEQIWNDAIELSSCCSTTVQ